MKVIPFNIFLPNGALVSLALEAVARRDSLDWKDLTGDDMLKRIMPKIKNGSIILFHNGTKHTASALPSILDRLVSEGYSFKSVGDMIYYDNYEIDHAGRQKAVNR